MALEDRPSLPDDKLDRSINELGLSVRTVSALENDKDRPNRLGEILHVFTVRELLACSREQLLAIDNFGEKTLEEVLNCLARHGFVSQGQHYQASEEERREEMRRQRREELKHRLGYGATAQNIKPREV